MSDQPRFYSEEKISARLGLSRDSVRQVRTELLEKEKGHWDQPGRDVVLSEEGLRLMLDYLFEPSEVAELNLTDCQIDAEKKENGAVDLTVKRTLPNRSLLVATTTGLEQKDVTVRVKDNSNFRPKMKLKALPPQPDAVGSASFYQLEGRCPRYPGRY